VASAFEVAGMQDREAYAVCPSDKRALGGGVVQSGPPDNLLVYASGPLAETKDAANTVSGDVAKRWYARVDNSSGAPVNLKVFAICSSATQGSSPGPGPTPPPNVKAAKVMSTVPKANATGVAPAANITATFSEDMMTSSINANTFKLFKKGSTTKLGAAVSYSAATDKAKLDPTNSLRKGLTYRAVVTTGAKDLAGNSLDQNSSKSDSQPKVWFFTVRR
jgi:Bacterial Ig-like domain